ncbi:MAG TPA: rhodanese-like domain-containing protein [Polyangium sp.]|jgi:phage shock protein E|nr:rhodanese-like domain-containing protein [Polyangium sp.]
MHIHRSPIIALVLALAACFPALEGCSKETSSASTTNAAKPAGLPDRDPALARKLVGEGAVLLDVRTADEYKERHLDKAVNIPVDQVNAQMAEIEKLTSGDKTKPIVVYCQAGGRAGRAKATLTAAGYTQVTNLGGIDDWDKK